MQAHTDGVLYDMYWQIHDSCTRYCTALTTHLSHGTIQESKQQPKQRWLMLIFCLLLSAQLASADPAQLAALLAPSTSGNAPVMTQSMNHYASNQFTPFRIDIPDTALDDLQHRLANTRWPEQIAGTSWEYGTDSSALREIVDYWQTDYSWREQEARLNELDHFKGQVDGLNMHFIHQRADNAEAIPLLLVHGWPGSIAEFTAVIPQLTNPQDFGGDAGDAFHVIAPSLPGFGFSEIPLESGYSPERIALVLAQLMADLGYERYALAGGDWGGIINRHLANHFPERLIALHSNFVLAAPPEDAAQREAATADELALRQSRSDFMRNELAYQQIQGTKPQSLGYGLNDSPVGLAAWIVEKFHGWTDMPQGADGDLDDYFHKDDLLTNVSIYWFTQTITSSMRIYYENRNTPAIKPMAYIEVPTGAAIYPAEMYQTPRAWAEAAYNIQHWTVMPAGGHFAALEQTATYLNDVRDFFREYRP